MVELAGGLLAWIAGATVGLASCAFWLALKLPMRIMDIFDAGSTRACGWAIVAGTLAGTLLDTVGGPWNLGVVGLLAFFLLAGAFVGMVASALTETLDVLPQCFDRTGLGENVRLLAWALVLGKMLGALAAVLWRL